MGVNLLIDRREGEREREREHKYRVRKIVNRGSIHPRQDREMMCVCHQSDENKTIHNDQKPHPANQVSPMVHPLLYISAVHAI